MKRRDPAAAITVPGTAHAPATHAAATSRRILRLPEVLLRVGVSRSTLYAQQRLGLFPPSIPLEPRAIGWLEFEVETVLEARAARASEEVVRVLVSLLVGARTRNATRRAAEVGR